MIQNIWNIIISSLIAIYAKEKQVIRAIELLTPRVSAVRRVAGVRRGEPRFAEPTWVVGVVRFGRLIASNTNKKRVVEAIELLTPRVSAVRRGREARGTALRRADLGCGRSPL